MAEPRTIDELVDKARLGDAGSWRRLVDRIYPWALRLARRLLHRGIPAEDAVQEAFCIAFSKLNDLREPTSFQAWFKAILHSQCCLLTSRQPPELSRERLDACGIVPAAAGCDPQDALCAMQLLAAADAAIEELPGHLRDVCFLHYRRGLTVPEVAQACGLPEGTVKKRLFTARPLLQVRLARFHSPSIFRVGYMPFSGHLLAMCADSMCQGRGLPLISRRYLSWAVLAEDLRCGRLDAAFIMAPLALSLRRSGTPLLYVLDSHHDGSSVAVSRLAGRRRCMGLPGELSTHHLLLARFMREKPDLFDLPTIVVNPSSVIPSMQQNKIGSFFCGDPWSAKCASQGLGDTLLRSRDVLPGHLCCILAVREEFALRRSQVVADYIQVLLAARNRVRQDPGYGALVQSAYTPIEAGVALQVLEQRSISFDDLEPDAGRMEDLATEAGLLSGPCSLAGFARRDFLPAATS